MVVLYSLGVFVPLVGMAVAVPAPQVEPEECLTRCIDGINDCGVRWGGCYNVCEDEAPTAPPCETITPLDPTTTSTAATPSSSPDSCSSRWVCADYINECSMMYGGCFPDCKPWPTFSPPPCPTTATNSSSSVMTTTTSESASTTCHTICVDFAPDSGMTGTCFDECDGWPTFTTPTDPLPTPTTYPPLTTPTGDCMPSPVN